MPYNEWEFEISISPCYCYVNSSRLEQHSAQQCNKWFQHNTFLTTFPWKFSPSPGSSPEPRTTPLGQLTPWGLSTRTVSNPNSSCPPQLNPNLIGAHPGRVVHCWNCLGGKFPVKLSNRMGEEGMGGTRGKGRRIVRSWQ